MCDTELVTQTPDAALVEPRDLLNSLTKFFSILEPLPPFSGDYFHVPTHTLGLGILGRP